ncbi:hypothetical protein CDAR_461891 [Caerostris darwini]|uniref:RNase H type-1 domain-containing protein n=1 Tax=Caerostris darwini TaxID=1538125 RepID=A0AAV4TG81_9ARAC|nr:hypothetical protein CDAR_461891 [Caerostris darwini]
MKVTVGFLRYKSGSKSDNPNAGAGVFSEIFSFYGPVGRGTAFDSEIAAIRTALSQLQCHLEKFTRAFIFCDSRAALLDIVSSNNPKTKDILEMPLSS